MNAICLVFDRLHAGYLGAYGNSWIETPAFDRLASQSFLFDRALIDSPELPLLVSLVLARVARFVPGGARLAAVVGRVAWPGRGDDGSA